MKIRQPPESFSSLFVYFWVSQRFSNILALQTSVVLNFASRSLQETDGTQRDSNLERETLPEAHNERDRRLQKRSQQQLSCRVHARDRVVKKSSS
jgi:hypothetical protein